MRFADVGWRHVDKIEQRASEPARSFIVLIAFNKPVNVLCQFTDSSGRRTLADFVPVKNVYAAGRLDYDSEGLILLTDDGSLQKRLADPRRLSVVGMGGEVESGPRGVRRERLQQWFDLLATWSYDLAACASGLGPRYHPDYSRELERLAAAVAPRRILRYHRTVLSDRAMLTHPLNPRLVAENALHGYRGAMLGE